MATKPPEEPPTAHRPGASYTLNVSDMARLPIPGNAEFAAWFLALIVAWLVAWFTDSLSANDWYFFFGVTTAAYLLSRGIAKASRVLEQ